MGDGDEGAAGLWRWWVGPAVGGDEQAGGERDWNGCGQPSSLGFALASATGTSRSALRRPRRPARRLRRGPPSMMMTAVPNGLSPRARPSRDVGKQGWVAIAFGSAT